MGSYMYVLLQTYSVHKLAVHIVFCFLYSTSTCAVTNCPDSACDGEYKSVFIAHKIVSEYYLPLCICL